MKHGCLVALLLIMFVLNGTGQAVTPSAGTRKLVIRKVIIEGNRVTRSSIILREMNVHAGDSIPADSLDILKEQNRLRIYNLELFNEIEQRTERIGDSLDWHIQVKERWYIIPSFYLQFADRNLNTWWVKEDHDLRRIMVGLMVTHRNFRGNLESLTLTVQGGYTRRLGIDYLRPYINKAQTAGIGLTLDLFENRQVYYTTDSNRLVYAGTYTGQVLSRKAEFGISYLYRPKYAAKHTFRVSYKSYWINDTVVKLNPDYFTSSSNQAKFLELFYRIDYNGVDNWSYPLHGYKLVDYNIANVGFTGMNFQAYTNLEAGMFRNPLPKWYFTTVLRGRLMFPQEQPYYFRSGLGTPIDYMRGYEYYVIDGGDYGLVRFDIKRDIFNKTFHSGVRYFTAIPLRLYPKLFCDVGGINSPQPGNSFLSNRLLYSGGIGLDVVTLYDIKLRFEYAWNHLGENGLFFHLEAE